MNPECFLTPHDGPKVMEHCTEPARHTGPHTWEKDGTYNHDGWQIKSSPTGATRKPPSVKE